MIDNCRNETRCRVLALTREELSLYDDSATGPGLIVQGACTTILRLLVFASSLAVFAAGTFLYVQYVRRFMR